MYKNKSKPGGIEGAKMREGEDAIKCNQSWKLWIQRIS